MGSSGEHVCELHGATMDPQRLAGRTLASVVASWHYFGDAPAAGPVDVWLVDEERRSTHVTVASDWCLLVEEKAPVCGYDMGEYGRIEIASVGGATPFARHVGGEILAVREEFHPLVGRIALELVFAGGRVRCDGLDGDLRLTQPSAR